ncbi:MAG: glycoside hydrolase family 15 protein [Actinobacteria bacterium]|nr:glycoside hydrolase family 15 protein [Actinomycetota bacterium]
MTQPPIDDYALIGDTRTAALCSKSGSIDWLCLPRFDSPPIFSRLVDEETGGSFQITPEGIRSTERRYRQGSAILETAWETSSGSVTLTEGLVLDVSSALLPEFALVRTVSSTRGRNQIRVKFDPRAGLPGKKPVRSRNSRGSLVCEWGSLAVSIASAPSIDLVPDQELTLVLDEGSSFSFCMLAAHQAPLVFIDPLSAVNRLEDSDRWWRNWSSTVGYEGPHRESVLRSLVTLRLLTYSPSGAPVAAPTTSLPIEIGGSRNWDYRFSWPRDASMGVEAFLEVEHSKKQIEAESFLRWLVIASRTTRPQMRVVYTLDGTPNLQEIELEDIGGHRSSLPVRIGNAAADQVQLDVYGWVLRAAGLIVKSGLPLDKPKWRGFSAFADYICRNWQKPDNGIWEVRGPREHYVHSKLMAWNGLDCAIWISQNHRTRPSRVERWKANRDAIASEVRSRGFDHDKGAYIRKYGSDGLDAANLILPTLGFEHDSERVGNTIKAIREELAAGGPLLYRYDPGDDAFEGKDSAFLACSFWLVRALADTGQREEAHDLFDQLCSLGNDVSLYGEQMDPSTKEHRGNFPQALTHAALLQAAIALRPNED